MVAREFGVGEAGHTKIVLMADVAGAADAHL
jgi:hypothetical protein